MLLKICWGPEAEVHRTWLLTTPYTSLKALPGLQVQQKAPSMTRLGSSHPQSDVELAQWPSSHTQAILYALTWCQRCLLNRRPLHEEIGKINRSVYRIGNTLGWLSGQNDVAIGPQKIVAKERLNEDMVTETTANMGLWLTYSSSSCRELDV